MDVITTVREMKAYVRAIHQRGETICLVPTMGYLHQGHLDLMRMGRNLADHLIISIFVNPTQFGTGEDLSVYPRDFQRDRRLSGDVGVECIFFPDVEEMYPPAYATYVNVEGMTESLCGRSRPTHFRGVTTVVAKLFNICDPDVSVFGQKDYQQLAVIRRMVEDLNMNVRVVAHPTVRETDGLAMSSRNKYLSGEQRQEALVLSRALNMARELVSSGEKAAERVRQAAIDMIASTPETVIDYVEIVHPDTLHCIDVIDDRAVMALAVKIGSTRLIDNIELRL
ncbi:MAG: pantoate--beta-alanine ligase [Desulfobacterota bacterium]|jgi:pantoate--beta-alanine ligase|nr:pantoate--beta-alanine ligase [Thermodesulfobacteriota bacterium]